MWIRAVVVLISIVVNLPLIAAPCNAMLANDELWLVSTRSMSTNTCSLHDPATGLRVYRIDPCGHANASSVDALLAPTEAKLDVVYVHGNRVLSQEALACGVSQHHRLRRLRPEGVPIRWIIWSWPSERDGHSLNALREKANRTDAQAHYLAWLLKRMAISGNSLRMLGYSFGSRVITGSLHVCAGGFLRNPGFDDSQWVNHRVHVAIIAAALDKDAFGPGNQHDLAGRNLASLAVFTNPYDPALNLYWFLDKFERTPAMGLNGPSFCPIDEDGQRVPVKIYNCGKCVGVNHDELTYYQSCGNVTRLLAAMIWDTEAE